MKSSIYSLFKNIGGPEILPFILAFLLLSAATVMAQNDTGTSMEDIYDSAEKNYNLGKFDDTEQILLSAINSMNGVYKTSAYRILALCELKKGQDSKAREYVVLMLKNNPYYTHSLKDPQRLVDLITEERKRYNGITTASRRHRGRQSPSTRLQCQSP